jgi:hypothetical protein
LAVIGGDRAATELTSSPGIKKAADSGDLTASIQSSYVAGGLFALEEDALRFSASRMTDTRVAAARKPRPLFGDFCNKICQKQTFAK